MGPADRQLQPRLQALAILGPTGLVTLRGSPETWRLCSAHLVPARGGTIAGRRGAGARRPSRVPRRHQPIRRHRQDGRPHRECALAAPTATPPLPDSDAGACAADPGPAQGGNSPAPARLPAAGPAARVTWVPDALGQGSLRRWHCAGFPGEVHARCTVGLSAVEARPLRRAFRVPVAARSRRRFLAQRPNVLPGQASGLCGPGWLPDCLNSDGWFRPVAGSPDGGSSVPRTG